jgi:3-deoxy-D-manno-octulosonic-acid transferase
MAVIYSLIIHLLYLLALSGYLFNKKIHQWISGRIKWEEKLKQKWHFDNVPKFWFHAASLGEFEQGLPIIEAIRNQVPQCKILLTFYSPSGYEIRKNYTKVDYVCYLPLDTKYNAKTFINYVKPDAAFFIKYDYWYFYLNELQKKNIPAYLISGIFRSDQIFFRWYGSFFRKELLTFSHFFLQDAVSAELLKRVGMGNSSVTGDTRFDRVNSIAMNRKKIEIAALFSRDSMCIIAGSIWPEDEELLIPYINDAPDNLKFIIAPHEVDPAHVKKLSERIQKPHVTYSLASPENISGALVLIIDNIGMLSSLYQYGSIAYIGGGFGKGIHNILEAAVFGMPVVFGPEYFRFREAKELIEKGGAFTVKSKEELQSTMDTLSYDPALRNMASFKARQYIEANIGATRLITEHIRKDVIQPLMQ